MLSSLLRILGRSFSSQSSSLTPIPMAGSGTPQTTKIYRERNLRQVVDMFIKASDSERFRSNTSIYEDTVNRLALAKRFTWIEEILEHQKNYKNISKEKFTARLIRLYGKSGMFELAHKVFEEMPELNCPRTVFSFNALLEACIDSKKFNLLEEIFRDTPSKISVTPDGFSYSIFIKGLCEMGSFHLAISTFDGMKRGGPSPNLISYNTLLSYLYGHGHFSEGEKIWAQLEAACTIVPNIKSYNARLLGFTEEKDLLMAVKLVDIMKLAGIEPDIFTFNSLIKGFCDVGNMDEAKKWFTKMQRSDLKPNRKTFGPLVRLSCENGDFNYARALCPRIYGVLHSDGALVLQDVVDELFQKSKVVEAKKLVELAASGDSYRFILKMPSGF